REDVAHQDEQRRGDDRERVHRLRHLLRHDRERKPTEADKREGRKPHRGEQRYAGEDGEQPDRRDLHHQMRHAAPSTMGTGGEPPPRNRSTISLAAWPAVTSPAITIGTYIQASETGSDSASMSRLRIAMSTPYQASIAPSTRM